jgi:hypothetical protein
MWEAHLNANRLLLTPHPGKLGTPDVARFHALSIRSTRRAATESSQCDSMGPVYANRLFVEPDLGLFGASDLLLQLQ